MCACLVEEKEEENRLGKAAQPEKKKRFKRASGERGGRMGRRERMAWPIRGRERKKKKEEEKRRKEEETG